MIEERLQDKLARLERERQEADRLYNAALTELDRAGSAPRELPHPPPVYDEAKLPALNDGWDILPSGPPPVEGGFKGRLRGFIWRLIGPPLTSQRNFNALLVEHLNRNVAAHQETQKAIASGIDLAGQQAENLARLHAHLIRYLQTITLYVDTKDRAAGGDALVLNAGLSAVTDEWLKRWESLGAREARYHARHDDLTRTYAETRDLAAIAQQTALTLKREVERLIERGLSPAQAGAGVTVDLESFKYLGFEDRFRGSREDIRSRLAEYVPRFQGLSDVLDLGCGRGEFLDLLRVNHVTARGLDLNHEMVEVCRAKGLDVVEGEALGYLASQPDASLGGIFAAQVIEHLEPAYLMRLIETAFHKLRPGGVIVLETINPTCWAAFFESYIRDLTHVRPIHPDTLVYLLRASGFRDVQTEFRSPIDETARLPLVPAPEGDMPAALANLIDAFNEAATKVNGRMFGYQDYAGIGRR